MSAVHLSGATRSPVLLWHRTRWITTAAVVLIAEGGLAILSAPMLIATTGWPVPTVLLPVVGLGVLNLATGVGPLAVRSWARVAAGVLSALTLAILYAASLIAAAANGASAGFDWLGIAGYTAVLYAVLRRWPQETLREGIPVSARHLGSSVELGRW